MIVLQIQKNEKITGLNLERFPQGRQSVNKVQGQNRQAERVALQAWQAGRVALEVRYQTHGLEAHATSIKLMPFLLSLNHHPIACVASHIHHRAFAKYQILAFDSH